jgi:hypothetical protein
MSNVPDGLGALAAQREKRQRRTMPPPRNPGASQAASANPASAVEAIPAAPETGSQPASATVGPTPRANDAATFKVTLYLDQEMDEFMERARVEGLTARPKVDVSRSAVARLALERLMADMTPREIKTLIGGRAARSAAGKTGRPRR